MYRQIAISVILLLFLTSCSTFALVERNFEPRGNRIAVVSGLNDETNHYLANAMTEALKKNSSFKVLSQKAVGKAIPNYPTNIQGPYRHAYLSVEADYGQTDIKRIKQIQKKLGVDYLYVLWSPCTVTQNGSVNSISIIGQMFEFPGAKEVGRGQFIAASKVKGGPKGEAEGVVKAADHVAMEIAMKMKKTK